MKSIMTLKVQRNKLEQVTHNLRERDKFLFQTCIGALRNRNKERAAVYANEVVEIRKLTKFLCNVELAIERVILRLETIKELSDIVVDLKPALRLLQNVSQELLAVLPDVSSELNNVNNTICETLYSTKITADESIIPINRKTPGGEEIMSEVSTLLERRACETLPEPPDTLKIPDAEENALKEMVALAASCSEARTCRTAEDNGKEVSQTLISYEKSTIKEISLKVHDRQFEDAVLEYVKKSNGRIDLERCSADLKTSDEEIEKALQRLGSKGKIRVELKAGE
jgi:division protein CdvB (Snf7/Vps24/ESCRT-III family)